jgi:hypothetical protein
MPHGQGVRHARWQGRPSPVLRCLVEFSSWCRNGGLTEPWARAGRRSTRSMMAADTTGSDVSRSYLVRRDAQGKPKMSAFAMTRHASIRANQRGVTHDMLDALIAYADFEASVGGGCTVLRLSRDRLEDRDLRASLGSSADRLASLAVVLADDTGQIVTVLHDHGSAEGRRYRRAHRRINRQPHLDRTNVRNRRRRLALQPGARHSQARGPRPSYHFGQRISHRRGSWRNPLASRQARGVPKPRRAWLAHPSRGRSFVFGPSSMHDRAAYGGVKWFR